jgi:hypothetical protein
MLVDYDPSGIVSLDIEEPKPITALKQKFDSFFIF